LITKLKQTGDADEFILEFLKPKEFALEKFGEPRKFHDTPCQDCFGSKMEIVKLIAIVKKGSAYYYVCGYE